MNAKHQAEENSPNHGMGQLPEPETVAKPTTVIEASLLLSMAVAVLALFLFAAIAERVADHETLRFDSAVRSYVHQYASPGMTRVMSALSFVGEDVLTVTAVICFAVFLWLGWRRAALWLLTTMLGALVLDLALKYAFHRTRPTPFFGALPRTYSFPSGHALFSFCFFGVMAGLWADRIRSLGLRVLLWTIASLLILSIGISRIYLGVHYPSDVLAGYLAAAVWVSTMIAIDRLRARRHPQDK